MPRLTGLFGGSFNPIHNGHITLARHFLRAMRLDEVWFLVSPQNPFKQDDRMLDEQKRLELVRIALEHEPNLMVSDYEFHLPRPSFTWNTLQALQADEPDRRFTLLIGGDNWIQFDRWHAHEEILRHHDIAIYPRHDSVIDKKSLPPNVHLLSLPLLNISSSSVRRAIARGESIETYVPAAVAAKLHEWRAYQDVYPR